METVTGEYHRACFKTTTAGLRLHEHSLDLIIDDLFQNHYGWIETAYARARQRADELVSKPLRLD